MPLTTALVTVLASHCAPEAAPQTLLAIAHVESGLDPLAIGVNGKTPHRLHPTSTDDAIDQAQRLLASGANIDLGLGQINVRNLKPFGLSLADAFDPCRNLAAAARVLQADYDLAGHASGSEQQALRTSLSLYNTGDPERGFRNGYVAKVLAAARQVGPALPPAPTSSAPSPTPKAPTWDVFGSAAAMTAAFVFSPSPSGEQP